MSFDPTDLHNPHMGPRDEAIWGTDVGKEILPHEPGYHLDVIPKGEIGQASKIIEEAAEFADAVKQGAAIMALLELADLIGAVEAYLTLHHPELSMEDLIKMASITKRAFESGHRS